MAEIPYIDQTKIQNQLNSLNHGLESPQWSFVNGENAFMGFNIDPSGKASFAGNVGYPVKLFFNSTTNELKMFPLTLFISYKQQ